MYTPLMTSWDFRISTRSGRLCNMTGFSEVSFNLRVVPHILSVRVYSDTTQGYYVWEPPGGINITSILFNGYSSQIVHTADVFITNNDGTNTSVFKYSYGTAGMGVT